MSDEMRVNIHGLAELAGSFARMEKEALPAIAAVVAKGALNVKNDWRKRWQRHPHIRHLPRTINYDLYTLPGSIRAEIGVDKDRRQGALANIIEYGSIHNAPIPGGRPALQAEEPRFNAAIEKALDGLLP